MASSLITLNTSKDTFKVGIALAAYQPDLEVFAQQLNSLQRQIHQNWICVITFDSPLQGICLEEKMKPYIEDSRFVWIENADRLGHKKNFEKAIQETLKYQVNAIACSDQDDIWYENKLTESVESFLNHGKQGLVHTDMHLMEDGKISSETVWNIEHRGISNSQPRHFYVRNIVAGCSMIFDADLARKFPVIPEEAQYHDHWYALVSAYFGGIHPIHKPLYAYRQHRKNEVGVTPFEKIFAVPSGSTLPGLVQKCKNGWNKSFRLASAAQRAGLPLTWFEKTLYLSSWDLGIGLLLLGILNWLSDPALARACFARGIGKAATVLELKKPKIS